MFWSVVTEWVMTLARCRLGERDLSVSLLQKPSCHVMFGPLKENTGNLATAECGLLLWLSVQQGSDSLTQRRLLRSHQIHNLMCGWEERLAPPGVGWALTSLGGTKRAVFTSALLLSEVMDSSPMVLIFSERRFTMSERSRVDTSLSIFGIICNQVLFTASLTVLEVAATQCWMRCWALLSSAGWQWPVTTADATTTAYNSFHFQSLTEGWL